MSCCTRSEGDGGTQQQSEWRRIIIATVLTFLCNVENNMLSVGEWPYMSQIDPLATSTFFGAATSVSKLGHALFAFAFAFWAKKSGMKLPLLAGRAITLVACVCYLFVEFLPANRRWWMTFCYFLFGVGFSTFILLRSYIARVSSSENRATAYALQNGAAVLSVAVGPIGQLACSGLPYPGETVFSELRLNIYTAPIWFALLTNIIAILFIAFAFQDLDAEESPRSIVASKSQDVGFLARLRRLDLPWILIALIIFERIVSELVGTTTNFLAAPILTTEYAMTGEQAVLTLSISQCIVGLLALGLSLAFYFFKLGKRVGCRFFFLLANILVIAGYLLTIPFPFLSSPMQPYNETTRAGCNPKDYTWCDSQMVTNLFVFLIVTVLMLSFALPVSKLCLDTFYSKMVGTADQNLMQALFVLADDVTLIITPIYASQVFAASGYMTVQIVNGAVYIVATILWIVAWRKLDTYN